MDSRKIKGIEHFVFENEKEFEAFFKRKDQHVPKIIYWKDAQEGNWARSDDGHIVQILRRKPFIAKDGRYVWDYVRTVVGTFIASKYYKMDCDFSRHPYRYSIGGWRSDPSRPHPFVKDGRKPRSGFLEALMVTKDPEEAFRKIYPRAKSESYIKDRIRYFIKTEVFLNMLKKEIEDAASKLGITAEYLLKGWKDDVEKKDLPPKYRQEARRELGKLTDAYPNEHSGSEFPLFGAYAQISEAETKQIDDKNTKMLPEKKDE